MIADFFAKPLQGTLYFTHRNAVLGIKECDMQVYVNTYKKYRESIDCIIKT